MSDRSESAKDESSSAKQDASYGEPGITLKVADDESADAVLEAIAEADGTFELLPASMDGLAQQVTPAVVPKKALQEPDSAEIYNLIASLPRLWPLQLMLLFAWAQPFIIIPITYVYWIFCSYRTSRVAKRVFGAKNIAPLTVLSLSLYWVVWLLSSACFSLVGPYVGLSPTGAAGSIFAWTWFLMLLGWIVYQFKWPASVSIAITNFEDSKKKEVKAWHVRVLEHIGTAVSMNLTPFFLGVMSVIAAIHGRMGGEPSLFNDGFTLCFSFGLIFVQFLGFHVLRYRIRQAALLNDSYRAYAAKQKKVEAKVSDDDLIVRYRAFAEWERWFKQRLSERSNKKLIYVGVVLVLFFVVGAPQWGLSLLAYLAPQAVAGAGGAGASALNNQINFLNLFQGALTTIFLLGSTIYMLRPTHLGFSRKGLRFLWRHRVISIDGRYMPWEALKVIRLTMPEGKTSPSDQVLLFERKENAELLAEGQVKKPDSLNDKLVVKLGSVLEVDDRERILKSIEQWAPTVERDATVLQALQPPADHSYTELWLQALSAPPKRERFRPLAEGSTLHDGRFEIRGQLGVGGQGTAYLAYDRDNSDTVVLKEFILPVYVDVVVRRQALERFENEARILKHLEHEQIVKLIDFFVEDHRSYLVLEHIEGKSLKQIVDESGPLPEARVLGLIKQMCTMLSYLHGLAPPVVHRDFTPDNLILRPDGMLKLVDFNVAQQTDSTATGTVVGKHAYLPPEQFRGTPVTQSDIYSMGATLHFLLTGKEPEPISVSHPRKVNEAVSDEMNLLVEKATAMSLERRFQDVAELRAEAKGFFPESFEGELSTEEQILLDSVEPNSNTNTPLLPADAASEQLL